MKLTKRQDYLMCTTTEDVTEFYKKTDDAHGIEHAIEVATIALYINTYIEKPYRDEVVIAAAMWHDIYATVKQRKEHHLLGSDYVLNNRYKHPSLKSLTLEEIHIVSSAIREHRASWTGEFTSKLSEVISAADRGVPNIEQWLSRSAQYARSALGYTEAESWIHAREHIKTKFGKEGYTVFSELYKRVFSDELQQTLAQVAEL